MNTRKLRKACADKGHFLGRFKARYGSQGGLLYRVAWCEKCGAAAFTYDQESPALTSTCAEMMALDK